MKLSKEKAAELEDLCRRTEIEPGYICINIKRPTHVRGTAPDITTYGCGCCSRETPLTKESLKKLIIALEDATKAAWALKVMYDSGDLKYGEMLEADADEE